MRLPTVVVRGGEYWSVAYLDDGQNTRNNEVAGPAGIAGLEGEAAPLLLLFGLLGALGQD